MKRVQFPKTQQKKFLQEILAKTNCTSLRELINRGFDIKYSTLKNYSSEKRNLPQDLFNDLCKIAKINPNKLKIKILQENHGQIKGGKISKR